MKQIENLMIQEADIMQKCRRAKGKTDQQKLRTVIEGFLDAISKSYNAIETADELDWVYAAIICWESFLRSEFGVCKLIPLPSIDEIPSLQKDEDIIEEKAYVHESGGKTLEDLAKNFEKLYRHVDQLMTGVSERQSRAQAAGYRTYTDLQETISQRFDYIGKQLIEHHYEMSSQHGKQTSVILDASGKPYSGKETTTKTAFTGYPKLADTG